VFPASSDARPHVCRYVHKACVLLTRKNLVCRRTLRLPILSTQAKKSTDTKTYKTRRSKKTADGAGTTANNTDRPSNCNVEHEQCMASCSFDNRGGLLALLPSQTPPPGTCALVCTVVREGCKRCGCVGVYLITISSGGDDAAFFMQHPQLTTSNFSVLAVWSSREMQRTVEDASQCVKVSFIVFLALTHAYGAHLVSCRCVSHEARTFMSHIFPSLSVVIGPSESQSTNRCNNKRAVHVARAKGMISSMIANVQISSSELGAEIGGMLSTTVTKIYSSVRELCEVHEVKQISRPT